MRRYLFILGAVLLILFLAGRPAQAMSDGIGRALSQRLGEITVDGQMRVYESAESDDASDVLGMSVAEANLHAPLGMVGGGVGLLTLNSMRIDVTRNILLPDTGALVPETAYGVGVGAGWTRPFGPGRMFDLSMRIDSFSDEPFVDNDTTHISAMATATRSCGESNLLLYGIFYTEQQSLLPHAPLPWAAFLWNCSEELQVVVGPTSSATWRPIQPLTMQVTLDLEPAASAEIAWQPRADLKLAVRGTWDRLGWQAAERDDDDVWLFLDEKRAELGLEWTPRPNASLHLAAGYAFDRLLFEGEDYYDQNNEVGLGDAVYAAINFQMDL